MSCHDHLQPQAREKAEKEGFEVFVAKTSFKANTKALAENEGEGLAKVILSFFQVKCYVLYEAVDKKFLSNFLRLTILLDILFILAS